MGESKFNQHDFNKIIFFLNFFIQSINFNFQIGIELFILFKHF